MREKKQINVEIGEQVRLARESAGLTQEQLAERIEVSPQFVSDLERGVVGISLTTLKRLCTVLGVSSDQILFARDSAEPAAVIAKKCAALSKPQQLLLYDMLDSLVEVIQKDLGDK